MQRVGIVDLGSNTARLVVYAYEPGKWFRMVDQIREPVRLGEGMGRGKGLTSGAIDRAVAALRLFSDYARATHLERLEVLATSALRDAPNRDVFFDAVDDLDLSIDMLAGETEASLSLLAVANSFSEPDAWVMDLGGGSAQISKMSQRRFVEGKAYPLGAVRLTEKFLSSNPPKGAEIEALEAEVARHLSAAAKMLRKDPRPWIAVGGTLRNLARIAQVRSRYPLAKVHGFWLDRASLEEVTDLLLKTPEGRRRSVPGLRSDRADIILAGALVYRWLMRQAKRDGVWVSGLGLREGAFFRHFCPEPSLVRDVRAFAVANLSAHYPQPPLHIERVRFLCHRLFDALTPIHGMAEVDRELLDVAARLHDIGMAVDYHGHHKHGAYLLENEALLGFDHREQVLLTYLVRYHRKGSPKAAKNRLLRAGDQTRLLQLTTCLRLAEQLERARSGRVRDLRVELSNRKARIVVVADEPLIVEIWEARKHAALFKRAFGRRLSVEQA